jgi:hypothetical protein
MVAARWTGNAKAADFPSGSGFFFGHWRYGPSISSGMPHVRGEDNNTPNRKEQVSGRVPLKIVDECLLVIEVVRP